MEEHKISYQIRNQKHGITFKNKNLSYRRGTMQCTMSVEIMTTIVLQHNCTKNHTWKGCSRRLLKGIRIAAVW